MSRFRVAIPTGVSRTIDTIETRELLVVLGSEANTEGRRNILSKTGVEFDV